MKNINTFFVAILIFTVVSCSQVDELAKDNTVLLTTSLWTFDFVTGYDDFTNQFAAALFTGMTYQFKPDGTYTAVIIGQSGNGVWEFNSDKTVITLEPGTKDAIAWTIITLSDSELKVTFEDEDALTGIVTMTFR